VPVERVAFLSSEYPPHTYGGLGTSVEALSRFLAAGGVEIVVLVPAARDYAKPPPGVALNLVPVGRATSNEDYWLTFCEGALDRATDAELAIDLLHCHDWMTALGGLAIGRAIGVPVVLSVHLPQVEATNLALENVGIAGCSGVLVNSHAVGAELARRDLANGEISVIPNGVDLVQFPLGDEPPDPLQILYVGRLVPQKGVDVLLRAFGAVLRRHPGARLLVAGDGQQRLYLERLARFLGVRQRVAFLGWQTRDAVAALYRASAVVAVPSRYEPFGLVALEAMASGRPVVVGRVGGLPEIVEDEVSGFTVEIGDHLDLAARLATLLSDPDLARTIGLEARRRAEQFDWGIVARRITELYGSIVSQPQPPPLSPGVVDRLLAIAGEDLSRRAASLLSFEAVPPELGDRPASVIERGHCHGR
jgi:1,4-alpha-glucan branching enzyme